MSMDFESVFRQQSPALTPSVKSEPPPAPMRFEHWGNLFNPSWCLSRIRYWLQIAWNATGRIAGRSNPRLSIAIILLFLGFMVIFTVFLGLPYIAYRIQEIQQGAIQSDQREQLKRIQNYLDSDDFKGLTTQTSTLEREFQLLRQSFEDFAHSTSEIDSTAKSLRINLAATTQMASSVRAIADGLTYSETKLIAASAATTNPSNPDLQSIVNSAASKLDRIQKPFISPTDLDLIRKAIEDSKSLLVRLGDAWKNSEPYQSKKEWRDFTKDTNNTNYLTIDNFANGNRAEIDSLTNASERLSKNPTTQPLFFTVDDQAAIKNLNDALTNAKEASQKSSTTLSDLTRMQEGFGRLLKTLDNSNEKSSHDSKFDEVSGVVASASQVINKSAATYAQMGEILGKLKDATSSLDLIVKAQNDIAFKGASPAAFLLFAIGGMFVTFGLRSLLKWVQEIDDSKDYRIWKERAELFSRLAVLLKQSNVEPSDVLRRLQAPIGAKQDPSLVASPISEVLTEIAKLLKQK